MSTLLKRLEKLEETIGVKSLTENSKQILNISESAEQELFDRVLEPLFKSWGIDLQDSEYSEYYDGEYYLDLEDQSQVKTPAGYDQEMSFFIDVQKFAKLVTKHFVKEKLIGREFLTKPLPQFIIPEVKIIRELKAKLVLGKIKKLSIIRKFINSGFEIGNLASYQGKGFWLIRDFGKETPVSSIFRNSRKKYEQKITIWADEEDVEIRYEFLEVSNTNITNVGKPYSRINQIHDLKLIETNLKSIYDLFQKLESKYS